MKVYLWVGNAKLDSYLASSDSGGAIYFNVCEEVDTKEWSSVNA